MKKNWLIIALVVAAVSASALPPPEKDEINIAKLGTLLFNLDGEIIEVEITSVNSIEQVAPGKYKASCFYYKGTTFPSGEEVLFPEGRKDFFNEIAEKGFYNSSSETVYLLVHSETPVKIKGADSYKLEAVGARFKKSKGTFRAAL